MAVNILIGVGGTGAKTVEAALVLMAAGMVEDEVHVGIVDQDLANGNVARATRLLSRIHNFRNLWSRTNSNNYIDWSADEIRGLGKYRVTPLFATEDKADALYRPNNAGDTLAEIMGKNLSDPQKHLFNMLFMADENEQDLRLDEGYRGRAHVGSAALISSLSGSRNVFLDRIQELIENSGGQPVNIFLVGSAFGGTGAAGFPTLARRLHILRQSDDLANRKNVTIGGLLMLPYFMFDKPDEEEEAVVTTDELLPKTKLALEYYHNLFEHEKSFDMFYTMGWDPQFPLGYHEPGAREQSNPALPTEMMAATAIVDFFRKLAHGEREEDVQRHASARAGAGIVWSDIPGGEQREYQHRMGQLFRFATYWRYRVEPVLREPVTGLFKRRNWAQKLAGKENASDAAEELTALRDVIDAILHWAATLETMGEQTTWGQGLWTLKGFLDRSHDYDPTMPVQMAPFIDEDDMNVAFDDIVRTEGGDPVNRNAGLIYDELVQFDPPNWEHKGIGAAVAAVYEACRNGNEHGGAEK